MLRVLQDATWERVEAHEVSDHSFVFYHVTLYDVVSWYKEVRHLVSCELNVEGEILQVFV